MDACHLRHQARLRWLAGAPWAACPASPLDQRARHTLCFPFRPSCSPVHLHGADPHAAALEHGHDCPAVGAHGVVHVRLDGDVAEEDVAAVACRRGMRGLRKRGCAKTLFRGGTEGAGKQDGWQGGPFPGLVPGWGACDMTAREPMHPASQPPAAGRAVTPSCKAGSAGHTPATHPLARPSGRLG